jgi:hypothetical protein
MPYVYSTISNTNTYCVYKKSSELAAYNEIAHRVTIKGGANVATATGNLWTPRGIATKITDDELEILEQSPSFRTHRDLGFLVVDKGKTQRDACKVAQEHQQPKDGSAPITPDRKDIIGTKKVKTNKE